MISGGGGEGYNNVASEEVCVRESLSLERRPVDGMYVW